MPCGAATQKVETATGITLTPVSEENSVTDVLGKVISGEADAGLVYVTDVKGAGDKVTGHRLPGVERGREHLPDRGAGRTARTRTWRRQFVDLVTGAEGQQVLADAGFGKP